MASQEEKGGNVILFAKQEEEKHREGKGKGLVCVSMS